jgi:hypothetical protein
LIWRRLSKSKPNHVELFTSGPGETEEKSKDEPGTDGGLPTETKPAVRQRQARRAAKARAQADPAATDATTARETQTNH